MVNIKEINAFEETVKVVEHVQKLELEATKEVPDQQKLWMVKEAKTKARTREEFESLEKEETELTKRLKFPVEEVIMVPEEHRKTVIRNYEVEKQEAEQLLNDYHKELQGLSAEMKIKVTSLLEKIERIEHNKSIALNLEDILDGKVTKNPGCERSPALWLTNLQRNSKSNSIRKINGKFNELTSLLLRISNRGEKIE